MPVRVNTIAGPSKGTGGSSGTGGGSGGGTPGDPGTGTGVLKVEPLQIIGLVPLLPCNSTECRPEGACYCINVFGDPGVPNASYQNDVSSFLVQNGLSGVMAGASVAWYLDKYNYSTGAWENVVPITDNSLGDFFDINTILNHSNYSGWQPNWGLIIQEHGAGTYRVRVEGVLLVGDTTITLACLASPPYCLRPWDCDRVDGTVKFEAYMDGTVGDINSPGSLFDICTMNWYDSIRFNGFFGFQKTPEYLEILHEYQNGQIRRVRDEQIRQYELIMHPVPKWLSDRFSAYGMMADRLLVSDYNHNNSDFSVRRREVVKAGGFEPEWYDRHDLRRGSATVLFKDGIQSIIKTSCCNAEIGDR